MNKRIMVIYDRDKEYARSLAEYLETKEGFPYRISVFTKEDYLADFLKGNEIALLLSGTISDAHVNYIVEEAICKERRMALVEDDISRTDGRQIFKYQSADCIARCIMQYCAEVEADYVIGGTNRKNTKLIGFFTPVRRCSQTTLGLTMGQVLAESCRTLYLNFESLSGFSRLLGYSGVRDIADLLYYLETTPENFHMQFQACVRKLEQLDYVPPMNAMHQLLLTDGKQWKKLIAAILDTGDYDMVLLDLSEGMQGLFDILRMCDHVYTLTRDDPYAKAKVEQYEQLLQLCEYEDVLGKSIKRGVPFIRELSNGFTYRAGGEFAGFIKKMLREAGLANEI